MCHEQTRDVVDLVHIDFADLFTISALSGQKSVVDGETVDEPGDLSSLP